MREVVWTDARGYRQLSLLRDDMTDDQFLRGIPIALVDVADVDWSAVQRELHNELVERRLLTWEDVQNKGGLRGAVQTVLRREVIRLMKLHSKEK